ncbi:hypothetical protein GSI_08464 [Ganoderma sinense ZZ0214-1]|uniref:Uncharacterized protein n=1 Tax=Ganoderma sinense ZZ0214-1 TaxID=1077348 RepID=A0A2G8S3S8_9APHY|nr:hypothetical protein GSI_08464 [Ganoderma sinense ZZ0214-1]
MLDIIVGESLDRTAASNSDDLQEFDIRTLPMPILGESDDELEAVASGYEDLALPVVGEDSEDAFWPVELPIVGEAEVVCSPRDSAEGSSMEREEPVPGPTARDLAVGNDASSVEDGASPAASDFQLPVVGEADDDSAAATWAHEDGDSRAIIAHPLLDVTASPCMFDGVLPGVTIATPSQDATPSPPPSPYSEGNEEASPLSHAIDVQMPIHQRLAYLYAKRDAVSATIKALEDGELTACQLQDSLFPTSPNFWRVYQNSLIWRGVGVDNLWEDLQS